MRAKSGGGVSPRSACRGRPSPAKEQGSQLEHMVHCCPAQGAELCLRGKKTITIKFHDGEPPLKPVELVVIIIIGRNDTRGCSSSYAPGVQSESSDPQSLTERRARRGRHERSCSEKEMMRAELQVCCVLQAVLSCNEKCRYLEAVMS